jgi:nucleoside-triphosphatase
MKNIFITGERGIGKSTLLNKVIKNVDCSIGGFIQEKKFTDKTTCFNVISLYNLKDSYTIGIYHKEKDILYSDMNVFNIISKNILLKSLDNTELIILDELGFMEESSPLFKDIIIKILDSDTPVLGVLKECDTNFIQQIKMRKDVEVIRIDENNRNYMEDRILDILESNNIRLFQIINKKD